MGHVSYASKWKIDLLQLRKYKVQSSDDAKRIYMRATTVTYTPTPNSHPHSRTQSNNIQRTQIYNNIGMQ